MITRKALGMLKRCTDGRDRKGRRIACQNGLTSHNGLKLGKKRLFGIEPFNDGFNYQITARQIGQSIGDDQLAFVSIRLANADPVFLH